MIMYRHGIPLISAEELGYHLGLTVPPDADKLFYKVRVANKPPSAAGYGTQIYNPAYEPNKVFKNLGIPLTLEQLLAAEVQDADDLLARLLTIEREDGDALLCFNHGVVRGEYQPYSGHVAVFDRVIDGDIRLVDASWKQPKWRLLNKTLMFEAIKKHGNENSGGIWRFRSLT